MVGWHHYACHGCMALLEPRTIWRCRYGSLLYRCRIYGWVVWKFGKKHGQHQAGDMPITFMPRRLYLPTFIFFFLAWGATYYVLITFTDSTVPLLDAFTNALSFVGLWALARKYIEQWFFWIIVDIICCYLYVVKGIPFKAALYGLYVIIAVAGYWKWKKMMAK